MTENQFNCEDVKYSCEKSTKLNVLIACEYSGITRNAFAALGCNAWSCDLFPSDLPGQHFQGDVLNILNLNWHLMIAHPPCTYLTYAGNAYWNIPGRAVDRLAALWFFNELLSADIQHICVENPLGIADVVIRKYDQIIQPYYFGDNERKRTCLWLKSLPKLLYFPADDLFNKKNVSDAPKPKYVGKNGKNHYFTEGAHGGHKRSQSFTGVATAMAAQWFAYLSNLYNIV